jgi:rSAM/selenodomain-associated transferase 2/rSAM/selenodomain-associated transferase 1
MAKPRRLILFTRYPEPGKVKTRLIGAIGETGATALHRRLVLRTLRAARCACQECDADFELRFDGGTEDAFRHWLGDQVRFCPQRGNDLGKRMAEAFEESFRSGSNATIIIGSDCPALTSGVLTNAFGKLTETPAVLGPASDGGYYLIGLTRSMPELFESIPWGTSSVLHDSLKILDRADIPRTLLLQLEDIDRPEDLAIWYEIIRQEENDSRGVSVIIPVLNESRNIDQTLEAVRREMPHEIIVADGGSSDATVEQARSASAVVIVSNPGRSRQMNAGAARATGKTLVFVHADTILPAGWTAVVSATLKDPQVAAGAFAFQVAESFPGKGLLEWTTNLRSRWGQMPYGDQALFLRQSLFEEIGGFRNLPILEDYDLVRRLRRHGRVITCAQAATTSGRRWQRSGLLRVTLKNQLIIAGFHLGVAPHKLAHFYRT